MSTTTPNERFGEIYDRGYAHYDGPRLGRINATWAITRWSMARALGIKKGWGAKVIPFLLYLAALVPVVVVIGISAFVPTFPGVGYPALFGGIFLLEGIFVATVTPEMLCPDRREGVLSLYASRPITSANYVIAKLLAAGILTLTISLLPALILWVGKVFLEGDLIASLQSNGADLGRVVLAGVLIAFYLGAIGVAISGFTSRKPVAVGIILVGFTIIEGIIGALTNALRTESWIGYLDLLSPSRVASALVFKLFGSPGDGAPEFAPDASLLMVVLAMLAVIAIAVSIMWRRYTRND